jgi:hypothetical protein
LPRLLPGPSALVSRPLAALPTSLGGAEPEAKAGMALRPPSGVTCFRGSLVVCPMTLRAALEAAAFAAAGPILVRLSRAQGQLVAHRLSMLGLGQ